jgi:hypothetical protein
MNRPANSLREIHLLWLPQTFAPLDQRLRALDLIRKRENDAAWKLMLGVLPRGHDAASPSATPRWRDFTAAMHHAGDIVRRQTVAVDATRQPVFTVLATPRGSSTLLVTDGTGYVAGDVLQLTLADRTRVYHRLSGNQVAAAPREIEVDAPLNFSPTRETGLGG